LWQLARSEPRLAGLREPLAERAECIAGLAVDAQSTSGPDLVQGAWFSGGETRMDDQQHAMSALLGTIPIADADDRDGTDRPAPALWLWLVALVAAFNPFRIARALPPDDRTRVAALGGLAGSAVVLGLALAADALLDVLDVSAPALRIAAGIVAAVTAVVGMVRRGPDPEAPALPGLRAALVPVAVPLVVGPALVVLALSASADRGLAPVALALAIGVAALTALAAARPSDTILGWAARATSAALLATSTLLVINGVFDV
jgi:small neutral amino acid transporter SnatA (MarC family)